MRAEARFVPASQIRADSYKIVPITQKTKLPRNIQRIRGRSTHGSNFLRMLKELENPEVNVVVCMDQSLPMTGLKGAFAYSYKLLQENGYDALKHAQIGRLKPERFGNLHARLNDRVKNIAQHVGNTPHVKPTKTFWRTVEGFFKAASEEKPESSFNMLLVRGDDLLTRPTSPRRVLPENVPADQLYTHIVIPHEGPGPSFLGAEDYIAASDKNPSLLVSEKPTLYQIEPGTIVVYKNAAIYIDPFGETDTQRSVLSKFRLTL